MSLYPGYAREVDDDWKLDDAALADSMAMVMEEELNAMYGLLGRSALSEIGQEDRRLLFVAIARGVLRYLNDHVEAIGTSRVSDHVHNVSLGITMDHHDDH
jgi:hypothetical protein